MKETPLVFIFIFSILFTSLGQNEQEVVNEIHLNSSLGLTYKRTLDEKSLLVLGFPELMVRKADPSGFKGFSTAFGIGLEFRRAINREVTFFHGPNFELSYGGSSIEGFASTYKARIVSFRLPYTIGTLFQINEHLLMSTQLYPNISYGYVRQSGTGGFAVNQTEYNFDFGILNFRGVMALIYRF